MAIVFEEALKKNIAKGELLPAYILFGEDAFLKKQYTEKILKKITEPDDVFNCCRFGADCSLQDLYDAVMQLPFMADKKYVELCDFDFEKAAKSELDRLCALLEDLPDSVVFVLRFDSVDFDSKKSAKFKRLVSSAEKGKGMAVRLDHRKLPELVKMLCDGAAKRGNKMEPAVARYLVENSSDDINTLKNELDKLCAFSPKGEITKQTVDEVCVKTVEASVYNLSKAITSCDINSSLKILDELFFMRIEPMIILHTVSSTFVDMQRVSAAKAQGLGISAVAETFGYKGREFVLEKAATSARKIDAKRLGLCLNALVNADNALKSFGAEPRIILEQLIIRLIYIIAKGDTVD